MYTYRKLMCLHLLPHAKIEQEFGLLRAAIREIENRDHRTLVRKLCDYVEHTWIDSALWPPSTWSVYMQEVRQHNS